MKIGDNLVKVIIFVLGAIVILFLSTPWFLQKAGLNVGFVQGFYALLVIMLILSPILIFVILLSKTTRKLYKEIPEDLKYKGKGENEFVNIKSGAAIDLIGEKKEMEAQNVKFRGLFTAYGKRLILTDSHLFFIVNRSRTRGGNEVSFKVDFDAVILEIKEIKEAKKAFGFPTSFLVIETKNYGTFEIQIGKADKWVEAINKLIES